jgi:hypothetical protein
MDIATLFAALKAACETRVKKLFPNYFRPTHYEYSSSFPYKTSEGQLLFVHVFMHDGQVTVKISNKPAIDFCDAQDTDKKLDDLFDAKPSLQLWGYTINEHIHLPSYLNIDEAYISNDVSYRKSFYTRYSPYGSPVLSP